MSVIKQDVMLFIWLGLKNVNSLINVNTLV